MLKQLSFDKNVLQYYGAFEVCGTPVLVNLMEKHCLSRCMLVAFLLLMCYCGVQVLEFMAGGDLRAAMNTEERGSEMLWYQRGRKVAADVARGLSWLHSRRVRGSLSAAMRADTHLV